MEALLSSKRIFVYGAGRSGFVARCFTMRLKHLGVPVVRMSVDPASPPRRGDMALIISGTGETPSSTDYAHMARAGGARLLVLTAAPRSRLASSGAEVVLLAPPPSRLRQRMAPLGTIFEEAALVYLDSLVAVMMERLGQTEDDMRRRHSSTR